MATYNGERYIREQLDSLATQTLVPCELVVSDDGSSDLTLKIIENFAASAPFEVKIHQNEGRLGFANNFLKAADICKGEIVAFCDQDDVWASRKLEVCIKEFADPGVYLCVHSSLVWGKTDKSKRRWPDFKSKAILPSNSADPLSVFPGFSMLVRKSALSVFDNGIRPTNLHSLSTTPHPMAHDQWVWFISSIFGKIVCLPETLAFYRQHDGNVYGAGKRRNFFDKIRLVLKSQNYYALSQLSIECALFLKELATRLPPCFHSAADLCETKFRERAKLQKLRSLLYDENVGLSDRLNTFLKICISGGYFYDDTHFKLGPKAAAKDLFLGVPGIYKIVK